MGEGPVLSKKWAEIVVIDGRPLEVDNSAPPRPARRTVKRKSDLSGKVQANATLPAPAANAVRAFQFDD